jgi:hypothetical protein
MTSIKSLVTGAGLVGCLALVGGPRAKAQESAPLIASAGAGIENLPDAPQASTSQDQPKEPAEARVNATTPPEVPHQTKRILGIVPNFRAVSADTQLPPQTPKDKLKVALEDSFDYSAFIFVGIQAGISQATDSYPAFHQGLAGYGRYYWHTFADSTDENLLVEGILPSVFHQDSRYYTKGHGGFVKRTAYSFSRTLITRTDAGNETFNVSEVMGAGGASGISSLYYPGQYRTWTKVGQRWLTSVIIDGVTFVAKEYWPDINSAVFHQKD